VHRRFELPSRLVLGQGAAYRQGRLHRTRPRPRRAHGPPSPAAGRSRPHRCGETREPPGPVRRRRARGGGAGTRGDR
jgi:hypothetical protein